MNAPSKTSTRAMLAAGAFFGLVAAFTMTTSANGDGLDSGPRAFPYRGTLNLDGSPYTGQIDLSLELSDAPNLLNPDCRHTETHDGVSVFAGAFRVNVGTTGAALDGCVFDQEEIYLKVKVRSAGEGEFVTLGQPQRIRPVPFAYWAAEGSDVAIGGNTTYQGPLNAGGIVAGTAVIRDDSVTNNLDVTGDSFIGQINQFGTDSNDSLTINGNIDLGATMNMTGGITVPGNAALGTVNVSAVQVNSAGALTMNNLNTLNDGVTTATTVDVGTLNTHARFGPNSNQAVKITGDSNFGDEATDEHYFRGNVSIADCRLCLLGRQDTISGNSTTIRKGQACIKLVHGQGSVFRWNRDVKTDGSNTAKLGLSLVCDGGNTVSNHVGTISNWAHE